MARETKVGLIVAFSFLALVGGVLGYKFYFSDEPFFKPREGTEQAGQSLKKPSESKLKKDTSTVAVKGDGKSKEAKAEPPSPPAASVAGDAKPQAEPTEPPPPTPASAPADTKPAATVTFDPDAPPPPMPASPNVGENKSTTAKANESSDKTEPPKPTESGLSLVKHTSNPGNGEKPVEPAPPMPPSVPTVPEKKVETDKKEEPAKVTIPPPPMDPTSPSPGANDAPPMPPMNSTATPKKDDVPPLKDEPPMVVPPTKPDAPKTPAARIEPRIEPESPATPKPPVSESTKDAASGSTIQIRGTPPPGSTPPSTPTTPVKDNGPVTGSSVLVRPQPDVPRGTPDRGTPVVMSASGSVGGPTRGPSQVQVIDVELYPVQQGETYATISRSRYRTENYQQALQQYNRERDPRLEFLRGGMQVYLPPAGYLEQRFGHLIQQGAAAPVAPTPDPAPRAPVSSTPTGTTAAPSGATNAARPAAVTPKRYRVQPNDTIWSIAKATLGNGDRWPEIHKLNRDVLPDVNQLRPGIELQLPNDATLP